MITVEDRSVRSSGRFLRCLRAELRKTGATRGTRWTLGIVTALWVVAGVGVVAVGILGGADRVSLAGSMLGMGAAVVVCSPIFGVLIMAGDWQSRDVLTLFALEPRRQVVFFAKASAAMILGAIILAVAWLIAVAGSLGSSLIARVPLAWDFDTASTAALLWGAGVGVVSGIAYGAALLRVAPAIVFALVQGFVFDPLLSLVPHGVGDFFRLSAIVDFGSGVGSLGTALAAGALWLVIPLFIGYIRNQRGEVQ